MRGEWVGFPPGEHPCITPLLWLRRPGRMWRCGCGKAWQIQESVDRYRGLPYKKWVRASHQDRTPAHDTDRSE